MTVYQSFPTVKYINLVYYVFYFLSDSSPRLFVSRGDTYIYKLNVTQVDRGDECPGEFYCVPLCVTK